jgi:exodeoxyribonuclease-5
MQWSPQQDHALHDVNSWFKSKGEQVYRLFGYAGTGKTTLAIHFAQNAPGMVKFAAFTGKAAHVMKQKGCTGATTIHKLIYQPFTKSQKHLDQLQIDLESALKKEPPDQAAIQKLQEDLQLERQNLQRPGFSLNYESELRLASLLIIDECSMVDERMAEDLLSFGVPILALGDPFQLPPVRGTGYFTEGRGNTVLTEIHRQARDNPIIEMSRRVREGESLPLGNYGDCRVLDTKLPSDDIMSHDIILVGRRTTKRACDVKARNILGRVSHLPEEGDRIMCIKNNHDLGLLNGQIWISLDKAADAGAVATLHIRSEDTGEELIVAAPTDLFLGQKNEDWTANYGLEQFEYSYAITVHKAQGSQWDDVLVFDEKDKFPNWKHRDRARWLYTAITRAAKRVTVMRI